jgi:PST family polysaccharide transporter
VKTHTYGEFPDKGSGGANVRWNGIALIGRQGIILLVSVLLARMLGPEALGIVAQANVFIALTTLMLDQGLTASLISQKTVTARLAGAASTLNLLLALVLFALTWALANATASFFNSPEMGLILPVLGASLIFKALAIVPRMLLTRRLRFKVIAAAEVISAAIGGVVGVIAAVAGLDYWSIVLQLVVTDVIAAAIFLVRGRPPRPNFAFRTLSSSLGFGLRVFTGNLVAFASRNVDNLLVGKFAGAVQLGYYSLAYRVLLTPVQMIGQTVTRVLFPAIARSKGDKHEVSRLLTKSTRSIALASFPLMSFVAVSAPDTITIVLGDEWAPAIPVLMILAVTGGRQAVTSTNAPLLLGMGRSDIHLRFNLVAAAIQIGGIVAGLPWGIVGVAIGYTVAGFVLTPLIGYFQKLLAGTSYTAQLAAIIPPLTSSAAAVAGYWVLYMTSLSGVGRVLLGATIFTILFALVLRLLFPKTWRSGISDAISLLPKR